MNVEELSYRELQQECKERDLKATGKEEELEQRLKEYEPEEEESSEEEVKRGVTQTIDEEPDEDVSEAIVFEVMDEEHGRRERRVYSREEHGDSFIELAEKYVETRPQEDLEIVEK